MSKLNWDGTWVVCDVSKLNWDGTWVVCDVSKLNKNCTKDVNNETLALNPESREESLDLGSENYFYHRLLLSTHYFIWAQFNNLT